MTLVCLLSCEHGGNHIPGQYAYLFTGAEEILQSHRGWDRGTPELFAAFSSLEIFRHRQIATVSRLLVDLNRSLSSRNLFSEFTRDLPPLTKNQILCEQYHPYRQQFCDAATAVAKQGDQILHVALHSFTPVLHNSVRTADIGLLYDPAHGKEQEFARGWMRFIHQRMPGLRLRANYPYRGTSDGHPLPYRKKLAGSYIGIELELNQNLATCGAVHDSLAATLNEAVKAFTKTTL